MSQILPKVIPINELKNTAKIAKTCKESEVPIVVTKNGYGEMVMMSVELYEQTFAKMQSALLINEGLDEIVGGAKGEDAALFFDRMRGKYAE